MIKTNNDRIPTTVKNKLLVEKRREEIVLTAINLFSQHGYHGTTLRMISEEANISYGNLYDYIGCKEDIFYLIHNHLCERFFGKLKSAIENITDPLEKLRRMVQAEFDFMDAWSDGIMLLYQEGHIMKPPLLYSFLKKEREHVNMFEEVINDCVQKKLLRQCNPRLTANLVKTTIDGWVLKRWDLRGHTNREEAEKFILDIVFTGLLPTKFRYCQVEGSNQYSLNGKRALVIGGETAIGSEVCSALTKAGALVCTYIKDDRLSGEDNFFAKDIKAILSSSSGPMDPSLFLNIVKDFGPIDICVHELGIGTSTSSKNKDDQCLKKDTYGILMEENFDCAKRMACFFETHMDRKSWGRLVYIAPWEWDRYADSMTHKIVVSGVQTLTQNLGESLSQSNVNVNCVIPGLIKTFRPSPFQKEMIQEAQQKTPVTRLAEIFDVINAIHFFLDDRSKYVNQQSIRVA